MSDEETRPAWLTTQPATNEQSEKPKRTRRTKAEIAEAEARGEKVRRGSRAPSEPASLAPIAPDTDEVNGLGLPISREDPRHPLYGETRYPQWLPLAVGTLALILAIVAMFRH